APGHRYARGPGPPLDALQRRADRRAQADAAVGEHLRGDSLSHRTLGPRIDEERDVRVSVDVEESGGDDESLRVDDGPRVFFVELSDVGDGVALDADVRPAQCASGPVGQPAVAGALVRRVE